MEVLFFKFFQIYPSMAIQIFNSQVTLSFLKNSVDIAVAIQWHEPRHFFSTMKVNCFFFYILPDDFLFIMEFYKLNTVS